MRKRAQVGMFHGLLEPGRELVAVEPERRVEIARGEVAVELIDVGPDDVGAGERDVLAGHVQAPIGRRAERPPQPGDRRPQVRPRARVEHVGPQPGGKRLARVLAAIEGQDRRQQARPAARRRRDRGPVELEAHLPEQPSVGTDPGALGDLRDDADHVRALIDGIGGPLAGGRGARGRRGRPTAVRGSRR